MKRQLSPSEHTSSNISKKQLTTKMVNSSGDVFSWDMMRQCLDETLDKKLEEKLANVARKDDLDGIIKDLVELKNENIGLKKEIHKLTSRIEAIDRRTRSSNIVVNGLECNNLTEAKDKFIKLGSGVLGINVAVNNAVMLKRNCFMFNLESVAMVQKVLSSSGLLKGRPIYIQKDYTSREQHVRYNLRQVSKSIKNKNKSLKIKQGDQCIFINDVRLTWLNDKLIARSVADGNFIENIIKECNLSYNVDVNQ